VHLCQAAAAGFKYRPTKPLERAILCVGATPPQKKEERKKEKPHLNGNETMRDYAKLANGCLHISSATLAKCARTIIIIMFVIMHSGIRYCDHLVTTACQGLLVHTRALKVEQLLFISGFSAQQQTLSSFFPACVRATSSGACASFLESILWLVLADLLWGRQICQFI
jgi:hypothetical protein